MTSVISTRSQWTDYPDVAPNVLEEIVIDGTQVGTGSMELTEGNWMLISTTSNVRWKIAFEEGVPADDCSFTPGQVRDFFQSRRDYYFSWDFGIAPGQYLYLRRYASKPQTDNA